MTRPIRLTAGALAMTLLMVLLLAATSRLPGMAGLLGSSLSVLLPPAAVR